MNEKKVMCNNCYSTEHLANSDSCEGISDWTKYVARFEKEMRMSKFKQRFTMFVT